MRNLLGNDRDLVILGSVLMAVGVFLPILSVPIIGTMTYIHDGSGDGIIVLILAVVAAALALLGAPRFAVIPGALGAALMLFTLYKFRKMLTNMRAEMENVLADNPFRGFAEAAMDATKIEWGWTVLAAGAALILFSGARAWIRTAKARQG